MRERSRQLLAGLIMLLSLSILGFGPAALTESDFGRYRVSPYQADLMAPRSVPELSARAALLMDGASETVLYARNEHERLPPASTTKMVTALVAEAGANLGDHVLVLSEDLPVGSVMGLSAGEEPSLRELMYGLLLVSDNAVAEIIARHVGGSYEGFVSEMNTWVQDRGLDDTHFENPHGLDQVNHYSTAHDLAIIARHVMESPYLSEVVGTSEQWAASRLLESTNQLLSTYPGANGVKTGTTDAAGQCLVASARRGQSWALVVVLGSQDRYADASALLDHYFATCDQASLGLTRSPLTRVRDAQGDWRRLEVRETARVLVTRWQVDYLRSFLHVESNGLGATPGEPVGRVSYYLLGRAVAELPVYLGAD